MSESTEIDLSNHPGCDSDGEFSVPSSYGSEVQESQQDCRKRPRQLQIQGNSWVLRAQITVDQLHADSDWLTVGSEGDVENEEKTAKINAHGSPPAESILVPSFKFYLENFVKSFCILFSATINISDVGPSWGGFQ